jgi:SAM-dependent methyltransferase
MYTLSNIGRVLELLQCPECRQGRLAFAESEAALKCEHCGEHFQVQRGILDLLRKEDRPLANKAYGPLYTRWYDFGYARRTFRKLGQGQFLNEFIEFTRPMKLQSTDIVVDVGCGTGNYTLPFAAQVSTVIAIGIDLSVPMLQLLTQHAQTLGVKNIIAIRANAENLPFRAGALGKVFNGCLHNLFPNIQPCLEETYRCLGPGGGFFGKTLFTAQPVLPKTIQQMMARAMSARSTRPDLFEQELVSVGFRDVWINPGKSVPYYFGYYGAVK